MSNNLCSTSVCSRCHCEHLAVGTAGSETHTHAILESTYLAHSMLPYDIVSTTDEAKQLGLLLRRVEPWTRCGTPTD